jgi:hypothetical protein
LRMIITILFLNFPIFSDELILFITLLEINAVIQFYMRSLTL